MDWLGAFFSLMALAVQNSFDVLGGVIYIVWYVMHLSLFLILLVCMSNQAVLPLKSACL